MNILLFNFEYPPLGGGGGVATSDIAQELAKRHTVHVITTAYRSMKKYELLNGVHIHRVSVLGRTSMPTSSLLSLITFAPSAFITGLYLTKKHSFDVINAHFVIPSGLPALWIAKIRKIPFVVTLIGGDIYDPSKSISPHKHALLRFIIRTIANNADAKTAISQDTKQRAIELHGIQEDIAVIPIGLVPTQATPTPRESLNLTSSDFLCVSIGRLVSRKGYETLLRAWKDVPNAHLIIVGDGPLKARLQKRITSYNLGSRVQLAGYISQQQKHALLRAGDLYVSAAQHEGFGIVFLEAMDAGLPIIAANDGGQRDFLEHGKNALLIPPLDPSKISHAVLELMNNTDLRKSMAKHNLHDVQKYYLEHTAKMLEEIIIKTAQAYEHHN